MLILSARKQAAIGIALAALLIATRGHHFVTVKQVLPSASWAVFFLAGFYLRPAWVLAGLLGIAGLVDYAAIGWGGVSDFCVSPAYAALIPAYGALWLAGRWYAERYTFKVVTLIPLAAAALVGIAVCEVISSGSFYFFSGRFPEPTLAEFGARLLKYGTHYLSTTAFWIGVAAVVHVAIATARIGATTPTRA